MNIEFKTVWTMLAGTVAAVVYMFTSFASAADLERIEVRLIKSDIREMRKELKEATDPAYRTSLQEDIERAIDELCTIKPEDRECKK